MCVVRTEADTHSMHGLFRPTVCWEHQKAQAKTEKKVQEQQQKGNNLPYNNTKMQKLCQVL